MERLWAICCRRAQGREGTKWLAARIRRLWDRGCAWLANDTRLCIRYASNSKLFLAISVGLLISNETLAKERGSAIRWSTKVKDLIPEWGLMDDEMSRGVTLQDMLSHRTGMPRHDYSGIQREGGISEMVCRIS